jgi:hypothetical protein
MDAFCTVYEARMGRPLALALPLKLEFSLLLLLVVMVVVSLDGGSSTFLPDIVATCTVVVPWCLTIWLQSGLKTLEVKVGQRCPIYEC